ncbi:prepilin peptidase CpaA [Faunimonas pinastri]|uniref:Prepilin peptidase CpaA n=1 Tax=Faunimonas pinastri TaxID=1855383 RepID=A0A1H9HHY2_9HYPH|nr:prepilin peptidase [Faunimonas pinastri]SEQ61959.1 prepilin peptidase CpaA [Faunimonas pinastri]
MLGSSAVLSVGSLLFSLVMIYAGIMDLTTMKIRNVLVLALVVLYCVVAPFSALSWSEIGWSVAVALGVFVLTFIFFFLGWIGGGDAKLAAAAALWFGAGASLPFFIWTAVLGGVLTLALLLFRSWLLPASLAGIPWIERLHEKRGGIPYGAAMAPAALIVLPQTPWMIGGFF